MEKKWSSEVTKNPEDFDKINEAISKMTPEQLREFRNQFNPDDMGFDGVEFPGEVDTDE